MTVKPLESMRDWKEANHTLQAIRTLTKATQLRPYHPPGTLRSFVVIDRMLHYGQNFVEQGIHQYELKFRLQRIKWLKKEAHSFNLQLVPA